MRNSLQGRRAQFMGLAVSLLLGATILASAGPASRAEADARAAVVRELWIPPGTYTAIVVATTAQERRWVVSLITRDGTFPITIGAAQTVVVPFDRGWSVKASDNARISVDGVTVGIVADNATLTNTDTMALSAWGIGPNGPVAFTVK